MAFDFTIFGDEGLDERYVDWLVKERTLEMVLHYEQLWRYYSNEMREPSTGIALANGWESARPYRQGQEHGLPPRITGVCHNLYGSIETGYDSTAITRKEVVVENDIAWRVDVMVDFLFGKPITIVSRARDGKKAEEIGAILRAVFDSNGGETFFQELSLLGCIYGFVDVILRPGALGGAWDDAIANEAEGSAGAQVKPFDTVLAKARQIHLEPIEAPRSLPILDESNYRHIRFFVQSFWQDHNSLSEDDPVIRTVNRSGRVLANQKRTHNVEILGPTYWQRYQDEVLVGQGINPLGVVPVVHIQNMSLPGHYEGQSDVEPLIPLQDELNTRLSDRANRVTFQSFKMYLGKGIDGFESRMVAPGRMWSTDNPDACIEEFGGNAGSPSEEAHISHVREALDKASGVASVAAGILRGRVGNLTSAVALKVTLMGVLAKTERKRLSYGQGIKDICKLVLSSLDRMGVYRTAPEEREIAIHWPSPLPENAMEKLQEATLKQKLGVPQEQILKELGYGGNQS